MNTSKSSNCPHCGGDLAEGRQHAASTHLPQKLQHDGHGECFVWCATCSERVYLSVMSSAEHSHAVPHHLHRAGGHGSRHHA